MSGRWRKGQWARVVLVGSLLLGTAVAAHAQSSLGLGNNEPGAGPPSSFIMAYMPWLQPVLTFINAKQQEFYRALTGALKAMRSDGWQVWWLVGLSFLYGVFHAAGPGHGKAVISSYMLANEIELKRGVVISFASAFMQGLTAIIVTSAGFLILRGATINMTDVLKWLEVASFGLITAFGLYLLVAKIRSLFRSSAPSMQEAELAVAGASLGAAAVHDHAGHGHMRLNHRDAQGHNHGAGEVCATCGHVHAPSPDLVQGDRFSLADAWAAITAVGLRPCSGALFVLTFSFLNGLYLGGVVSVIAMSVGTAITVSILATIAVTSKGFALRLAGEGSTALRLGHGIELLGALGVVLFGLLFLAASLQIG